MLFHHKDCHKSERLTNQELKCAFRNYKTGWATKEGGSIFLQDHKPWTKRLCWFLSISVSTQHSHFVCNHPPSPLVQESLLNCKFQWVTKMNLTHNTELMVFTQIHSGWSTRKVHFVLLEWSVSFQAENCQIARHISQLLDPVESAEL